MNIVLQVDDEDIENSPLVDKIRQERGYNYKDVITVSPEKLENYETKVGAWSQNLIGSQILDVVHQSVFMPAWTKMKEAIFICEAGVHWR